MRRLLLSILFIIAAVASQERLRLVHADELESITDKDGKATQFLRGNVKFRKGEAILTSDRAYFRQEANNATFVQNVRMERGEQLLTADSLHLETELDIVTGYGRNEFSDPDYYLTSDTLEYHMEIDSGAANGPVKFVQQNQTIPSQSVCIQAMMAAAQSPEDLKAVNEFYAMKFQFVDAV